MRAGAVASGTIQAADRAVRPRVSVTALHSATLATPASESTRPGEAPRLLVITYCFPPDGYVGGLRWAGITKYLSRLGWEVSVLTAAPPVGDDAAVGAHLESCPRLWTLIDCCRWLRRRALGRSRALLPDASRVARASGPRGLLRQLRREVAAVLTFPDDSRGWILRATLRARSLIRRFQPHVVVSSGPPHSAHLVAGGGPVGGSGGWVLHLRHPGGGPLRKARGAHPEPPAWGVHSLPPRLERPAFP